MSCHVIMKANTKPRSCNQDFNCASMMEIDTDNIYAMYTNSDMNFHIGYMNEKNLLAVDCQFD